jgi:hypothetical protein
MGCDIHSYAERRNKQTGKWEKVTDHFSLSDFDKDWYKKEKGDHPFDWRHYSMFAFLAGVRNYDRCDPISEPRGIPDDTSESVREEYEVWDGDSHSASFLSAKELLEFDYDKKFWDRRVTKQTGPNSWTGAGLAEEGEGRIVTYRENLGDDYFKHLEELEQLGDPEDVRIVFWFDN